MVVNMHDFELFGGLGPPPFNYLDQDTGEVYWWWSLKGKKNSLEYPMDITNPRYLRLPSIGPYLVKTFFEVSGVDKALLKRYGIEHSPHIEKYLYYSWDERKSYHEYMVKAMLLREENRLCEDYGIYTHQLVDEEHPYDIKTHLRYKLSKEWLTSQGIEIFEDFNGIYPVLGTP